ESPTTGDPDPAAHTETEATNQELQSPYPWGGSTAFYDAVDEAVSRLEGVNRERRNVVAMTDGADNASTATRQETIDAAEEADATLHTVGLGSSPNKADLQEMADKTGGSYFGVQGTDLGGTFTNIQTGIRFQYRLEATQQPTSGADVQLRLDHNGLEETAEATAP
ncbi:MAG: vWA domain-containing protein, partial [Thiohalospira sp.]